MVTLLVRGRAFGVADWVKVADGLSAISAGSRTTVWGVNSGNQIYRYTGDQGSTNWVGINGSLVRIDAGSRTNAWGVDFAGGVYRYTNHDASGTNPWIKIPGIASDGADGADGTVWHVNAGGEIFRYTGDQPSRPLPEHQWGPGSGQVRGPIGRRRARTRPCCDDAVEHRSCLLQPAEPALSNALALSRHPIATVPLPRA